MNKKGFERALSRKLRGLSREERQDSVNFYREMIQDRVGEGMSEEDAVAQLGDIDELAAQLCGDGADAPKKRAGISIWQILLIVLGSPIWLSMLLALLAVLLSVFVVAWIVVASLYAVVLSLAVCGPAGIAALALGFIKGIAQQGVLLLATGCAALGVALLLLPLLNRLTVLLARFTRWSAAGIVKCLKRRRA